MSETNLLKGAADLSASVALLRFTGDDREAFLQGQLTNDVRHLTADSLMTAGWCSPKGRLLAVFQLFKDDEALYALTARETLEATMKRLRMYILRSKVKVEEVKDLTVAGIVGDLPAELDAVKCFTETTGTPEALAALGLAEGRAVALVKTGTALTGSAEAYWAATAAAGVPFIVAATSDKFVPQAVNLECIGGVSFNKGCYTGQEIVSRVEHIGKTARRAALFACGKALPAGSDITDAGGNIAGTVVLSASAGSRAAVLAQVAADKTGDTYRAGEAVLTALSLPYSYSRSDK